MTFDSVLANATKTDEIKSVKPPPRPRPGTKGFLTSVLNILSKSTTGTQYPDADGVNNDKKGKIKKKLIKEPAHSVDAVKNEKKKKPKYSKILNKYKNQFDEFEVLQFKKAILQTPSLYSERSDKDDLDLSDLATLVKPETNGVNENYVNNLMKEVIEGRKAKEKKGKIMDLEPATLVTEHGEDKRLYNFFVDLLETTLSVYNVEASYDAAPNVPSAVSSRIALEMDDSVARKLNVATEMFDDVTQKPSKHFYCLKNECEGWNDQQLVDYFQASPSSMKPINELPLKSPTKKRRLKTESFAFTRRSKISPPRSKSVVITQRKSFYRNNQKMDLLNLLKEQLKMDHLSFEEPQNLYQALKVMAKTKRKHKTISFERPAKKTNDGYRPPECMLKRRNIISASTKSNYKHGEYNRYTGPITKQFSEVSRHKEKYTLNENPAEENLSNHSLEVYGFEYEDPCKKPSSQSEEKLCMMYHSSRSNSDNELSDELQFLESHISTFTENPK